MSEWLFKGGTCLKKCYFETYRFSEDLDFTVPNEDIYDKDKIMAALNDVADIVLENTGINLKIKPIEVKESVNKNNRLTFTAKYSYIGPLNIQINTPPRIKFDISNDEIITDLPDFREVFHSYSDRLQTPIKIKCYSINEILAEKSRALYERQGRSRDIYDVVNISRNFRENVDAEKARNFLLSKFRFKNLPRPSVELILSQINLEMLRSGWDDQLRHQLQTLPPVESFISDLRDSLSWWIDADFKEIVLSRISESKNETDIEKRDFPISSIAKDKRINGMESVIEQIRYAARNRMCIKIEYEGVVRIVEPYSLRHPRTGNTLFYGYEIERNGIRTDHIKAYNISSITIVEITQDTFTPRYVVEF